MAFCSLQYMFLDMQPDLNRGCNHGNGCHVVMGTGWQGITLTADNLYADTVILKTMTYDTQQLYSYFTKWRVADAK